MAALAVVLLAMPAIAGPVAAAGTHYYVDGKNGSDANPGTSLGAAFRTVKKALGSPMSPGTVVSIVGYAGFTYYEQLDRPYQLQGTSSAPIVIEGYRPPSGTFVRPTISGALVVNDPGSKRWTRPNATAYPNVWRTAWTTAIKGYDSAHYASRMERVFFDTEHQLIRPAATPTLAQLEARPGSQYWDGRYLYVNLGRWDGVAVDRNPNNHRIVIPHYFGLTVNSFSSWVTIRDLNVIHASPGITFHRGSKNVSVSNVDVSYNYPAGLTSQAVDATFRYVTGRRNTMQLIKLQDGATRTLIEYATSRQNPAQGIKITDRTTTYTTVRSSKFIEGEKVPSWAATYSGEVQGITLEQGANHTNITNNTISGMTRGLVLYQVNSSGGPLNDTVVSGNSFANNLRAVMLWDGKDGGNSTGNVKFHHNTYYHNGNAVFAKTTTTNKWFDHETIYWTYEATGTARAAVLLQGAGTNVKFTNSIVTRSPTYVFMAIDGATATVTHTDIHGYAKSKTYGSVTLGSGNRTVDPAFVSTTPGTTGYLVLPKASILRTASTTGGVIGSK